MQRGEFVALIAMLFSTVAFSIDSLLVAFPEIEAELAAEGRAHLVVTLFMAGLGLGTLIAGPISDAIGRKSTMYIGAALYVATGLVAWAAQDFTVLLVARFFQGVATAGPRVVSMAVVRDLYSGRQMAQILSFAMVLFTIVPTLAPAMGAMLQAVFGWRAIILALVLFSVISTLWLWLRLPESLAVEDRRPLRFRALGAAATEIARHRTVRLAILAQCVAIGMIFSLVVQAQPIYDQTFGRAESFPYWFGGIALVSAASTSLLNAVLVVRFGMRRLVTVAMIGHVISAASALAVMQLVPDLAFPAFVFWQFMVIWLSGMIVGNLNTMALEPMGHIAGFTASITGATATLAASAIAGLVGLAFDGTAAPLLQISTLSALFGLTVMWRLNRTERRRSNAARRRALAQRVVTPLAGSGDTALPDAQALRDDAPGAEPANDGNTGPGPRR